MGGNHTNTVRVILIIGGLVIGNHFDVKWFRSDKRRRGGEVETDTGRAFSRHVDTAEVAQTLDHLITADLVLFEEEPAAAGTELTVGVSQEVIFSVQDTEGVECLLEKNAGDVVGNLIILTFNTDEEIYIFLIFAENTI